MTRTKLQKILNRLDGKNEATLKVIADFDAGAKALRDKLEQDITATTLDEVNRKINQLRKSIDINPLLDVAQSLKGEFKQNALDTLKEIENRTAELRLKIDEGKKTLDEKTDIIAKNVANINEKVEKVSGETSTQIKQVIGTLETVSEKLPTFADKKEIGEVLEDLKSDKEKVVEELKDYTDQTRIELINKINNKGGGNMNRNITVNANSVLSKYTDFNIQNSSTIGWTTSVNETLRRVDFFASVLTGGGSGTPGGATTHVQYNDGGVFAGDPGLTWASSILTVGQQGSVRGAVRLAGADTGLTRIEVPSVAGNYALVLPANDGGAGQYLLTDGNGITQWASVTAVGGSGITRSVSVISVSSTFAEAAITDYVAFANVGIALTLPTALSNSNLYTVKNVSGSSIIVLAPTGQDIDGSANALMAVENESRDFISNGSIWGVV